MVAAMWAIDVCVISERGRRRPAASPVPDGKKSLTVSTVDDGVIGWMLRRDRLARPAQLR